MIECSSVCGVHSLTLAATGTDGVLNAHSPVLAATGTTAED